MSKGKPNKAVFRKLCHSKEALTAEEKQETRTKRKKQQVYLLKGRDYQLGKIF